MALQVWLPLNGNLNNQGLNNTAFTGSTTFEAGKIGQAGVFGTNAKRAISSATVTLNSQVTIAFWIKIKTWVNWGRIFNLYNSDKTNTISCVSNTSTDKRIGTQVSKNGTNLTDSYNGSFDLNTWYHFTMVINGTTKQHYINGSLVGTATLSDSMVTTDYTVMCGGTADGGTPVDMDMNDFRIYDHALSAKEVEVLSRGLVCHYPLNGGGRGGDNLLKNTGDLTLWAKESGITTTWDSEKNLYKIVDSTHTSSRWGIYQDINIEANTSYTITCTLNGDNCAVAFGFYDSSTSFPGNLITVTDSTTKRLSYTVTSGANSTKARVYLNMNCANSATKTAWFGTPKVEKGSVSTPWIPNSADTAYSAMGYNSTTEYDVSGYGNNMTKTGTITYTTDSARYSVASHFINGSYIMANQNCGEYLPKDSLTVNIWVKPTTWGTPISCTEGGGWNIELSTNGLQFQCYISGVGYKGATSTVKASDLIDGKWHMLTGVFDRAAQQTRFYIDGELKGSNATGSTNGVGYANNRLIISGEAQSTTPASSAFVGEESDVRIYATALSAAQVAELYNTAVSVANNGTLMGYELVEV